MAEVIDNDGLSGGPGGNDLPAQLHAAQQQVVELATMVSSPVLILDLDLHVHGSNEAAYALFGPTAAGSDGWLLSFDSDDRKALDGLRRLGAGEHMTASITHRSNGETIDLRTDGVGVFHDDKLVSIILRLDDPTNLMTTSDALREAAARDVLTGLPNRIALMDRLESTLLDRRGSAAVLFIDLDGFKLVNDTQGHSVGDVLLKSVAERLASVIRPQDLLVRFGGDEFVVVADIRSSGSALVLANRLHNALVAAFPIEGRPLDVTASVGIAIADVSSTPEQLLSDADLAMYGAKRAGRNRTVLYHPGLREAASQEFDLTNDLRYAIERRELRLHYQPIYDLTSMRAVGAEALMRWEHPGYGRVSPQAFIRVAEEHGLINEIGDWVIEQACADLAQLRMRSVVDDKFYVSINVSMMQLSAVNNLVDTADAVVMRRNLDTSNLLFELTETVPVDAIPLAAENIMALNDRGYRLAIDDFGTGYSSLEYLTLLPFDALKIDPSFTARLGGAGAAEAVLESLAHLSEQLGFELICEGIESAAQVERVMSTSVRLGQGYFFARPAPFERLYEMLVTSELRSPPPTAE